MNSKSKKFSVNDLISKNEKKKTNKHTILKSFLDNCKKKIETYNTYGHESILYEVPSFIIGLPPYNPKEIQDSLVEFLKEAGFYVLEIPNTFNIFVSWKKSDVDKINNQKNGFLSIALNKNGFFDNLPINTNNLK